MRNLTGYIRNILNVSGNWNNGSNAGLGNVNLNNESTNSNSNIGSRLELRMFNGERTFYEQRIYPHQYQVEHTTYSRMRLVCESTERLMRMFLPTMVII